MNNKTQSIDNFEASINYVLMGFWSCIGNTPLEIKVTYV